MKKIIKTIKQFKRIKMHRELRLSIIAILGLIIIASSYNAYSASQEPTTIEKITPNYTFTHTGVWDYQVYIKNNSLYDTNVLNPGEGVYFKKLIENVNVSYTYRFVANQASKIHGTYKITALVQTQLWSKEFIMNPITSFNSTTNQAKFIFKFPLNTTIYEDFVATVNAETGSSASDPTLVIICDVLLSAEASEESIDEAFSTSIQVPLRSEDILNIEGNLNPIRKGSGSLENTQTIYQAEVTASRNNWTASSIILLAICIGFVIVTQSDLEAVKSISRQVKKIKKKYGEWIVEVEKPPRTINVERVTTKSLEDLVKISEELAKPIIYYSSDKQHNFYVLDENIQYKYELSNN